MKNCRAVHYVLLLLITNLPSCYETINKKGIRIAPAPAPQEVLPSKPIIIAPMMVRQHRRKDKYRVMHAPVPMSHGIGQPYYPLDYGRPRSLVNRKLNNLTFNNVESAVPAVDGKINVSPLGSKLTLGEKKLANKTLQDISAGIYSHTATNIIGVKEALKGLKMSLFNMKNTMAKVNSDINENLTLLKSLKGDAKSGLPD